MRDVHRRVIRGRILSALILAGSFVPSGCVSSVKNAIPAACLPAVFQGASRDELTPIDLSLLRQPAPATHRIGPGDVLGIHIQDVMGGSEEPTSVYFPPAFGNLDFGNSNSPAAGSPILVDGGGMITLPQVPPVRVFGLTLVEATDLLRRVYTVDRKILQPERARVTVTLMRSRTCHVLVVREDTPVANGPVSKARDSTLLSKRGSAHVIELPAYQNDVLHALSLTGGLPGVDAKDEIIIFRGEADQWEQFMGDGAPAGSALPPMPLPLPAPRGHERTVTRIPLRLPLGTPLPIGPEDIRLRHGDVIFIASREAEHFFTGGLLPGGQFPIPRDYSLDVLGAIAVSGGSPAGSTPSLFGPSGGIIPPSRVLILRTLPNASQVLIHVDVKKALRDPKERVRVMPRDVVMLQYTLREAMANYALSIIGFRYNLNQINGLSRGNASVLPTNN